MNYSIEFSDNVLNISFQGDILGENAGLDFIENIEIEIEKGHYFALLDLSDVRYINSTGIGIIVTLLNKFKQANGKLVIVNPSQQLVKILNITKLDSVFTIFDTKQLAIEYLIKK